ncbi:AAC(3) family N-acetyltransferase [Candidatus Poribacteria bacterium]|nr:AAC(3) family N-acetyltransferase [Candidatus Poribacteria bacterium]
MPEQDVVERTDVPLTAASLADQLRACGMAVGQTVLAHVAMSKLGWVVGGAEAVILALIEAVGGSGTIVMVTYSTNNGEPSLWQHPPVPEEWWQTIRDHTPAYNPQTTPTRGMGVVPELFRTWPDAVRSAHPAFSLAALGARAEYIVAEHSPDEMGERSPVGMGERSPVGKVYELDGHVLLLGIDHRASTSLHLAEARAGCPGMRKVRTGSAMLVDGRREWVTYVDWADGGKDFHTIGDAFDAAHDIPVHRVGAAEARFFQQRPVVDFGVEWMRRHRDAQT